MYDYLKKVSVFLIASVGGIQLTWANPEQGHSDYANVVRSTPVYRSYEERIPKEHCWVDKVRRETRYRSTNSASNTLAGAVVGGAIGHAVGHGRKNKQLGAVVGSVIGVSLANRHRSQQHNGRTQVSYDNVERCKVTYDVKSRRSIVGYDVEYRYQGRLYSTHLKDDPGKRLKVAVFVEPVAPSYR